jgi:Acetyltransferases
MDWRIRQAGTADLDGILEIENACFSPGIREDRTVFLDRMRSFPDGFLLLVPADPVSPGQPAAAGYLSSEIWDSVPPASTDSYRLGHAASERHSPSGPVLYISSFAVHPSARGGTGRFLLEGSVRRIHTCRPGLTRIVFIVNETWAAARHIYETGGFRYTGRLENFFSPEASAALVMEREL